MRAQILVVCDTRLVCLWPYPGTKATSQDKEDIHNLVSISEGNELREPGYPGQILSVWR